MQDVADDHDPPAPQGLRGGVLRVELTRKRKEIQQTLTGVAVQAVAAIEDRDAIAAEIQVVRQGRRNPRAAVTDDEQVGAHGHVGAHRVEQALAFAQGTGRRREALNIRGQSLGGQLKAAAGAGAGLKKKGGDELALQGRQLAGTTGGHRPKALGQL